MIDRAHDLPDHQASGGSEHQPGSVYYLPRPVSEADLAIMRRLDRLHLEFPFAGTAGRVPDGSHDDCAIRFKTRRMTAELRGGPTGVRVVSPAQFCPIGSPLPFAVHETVYWPGADA